jgi:hypothetical protein
VLLQNGRDHRYMARTLTGAENIKHCCRRRPCAC